MSFGSNSEREILWNESLFAKKASLCFNIPTTLQNVICICSRKEKIKIKNDDDSGIGGSNSNNSQKRKKHHTRHIRAVCMIHCARSVHARSDCLLCAYVLRWPLIEGDIYIVYDFIVVVFVFLFFFCYWNERKVKEYQNAAANTMYVFGVWMMYRFLLIFVWISGF